MQFLLQKIFPTTYLMHLFMKSLPMKTYFLDSEK